MTSTKAKHSYAYDIYFGYGIPLSLIQQANVPPYYPENITETQLLNNTEFNDPNLFFAKYSQTCFPINPKAPNITIVL